MSPTQLTLKRLREEGWTAQVVEKWNPFAKIRQDLFGCIDIVAVRHHLTLGIQTTTYGNRLSRIRKISKLEEAKKWILAGNDLEVWSWKKERGKWVLDIHQCQPSLTC